MLQTVQSIQERIFDRLPFSILLRQIIECFDGQSIHRGVPFDGKHPKRSPTIKPHPGSNLFERLWITPGGWPGCLWLASHLAPFDAKARKAPAVADKVRAMLRLLLKASLACAIQLPEPFPRFENSGQIEARNSLVWLRRAN
jgi:hypothetical protein